MTGGQIRIGIGRAWRRPVSGASIGLASWPVDAGSEAIEERRPTTRTLIVSSVSHLRVDRVHGSGVHVDSDSCTRNRPKHFRAHFGNSGVKRPGKVHRVDTDGQVLGSSLNGRSPDGPPTLPGAQPSEADLAGSILSQSALSKIRMWKRDPAVYYQTWRSVVGILGHEN